MTTMYFIAKEASHQLLQKTVNEMLNKKWRLHGDLIVIPNGTAHFYIQAMIM